jgi:hypothetical protein
MKSMFSLHVDVDFLVGRQRRLQSPQSLIYSDPCTMSQAPQSLHVAALPCKLCSFRANLRDGAFGAIPTSILNSRLT